MAVSVNEVAAMVARMRRQGTDDAGCEAKACERRLSSDVWESVSAFANTSGGVLLLGIDERSGFVPARGFDAGRVRDQFIEGIGDGGVDGAERTRTARHSPEERKTIMEHAHRARHRAPRGSSSYRTARLALALAVLAAVTYPAASPGAERMSAPAAIADLVGPVTPAHRGRHARSRRGGQV